MKPFSVSFPFSNRTNKSGFFYLHKSLDNTPDAWKAGIALSPYSAVRARSKFTWETFVLHHIYFGVPNDIAILEELVKRRLYHLSGAYLNGNGGQTEIFKITEEDLLSTVQDIIVKHCLRIFKLELKSPYSANNKSACPFKLPCEDDMQSWTVREVERHWPGCMGQKKVLTNAIFNELFEQNTQ